MSQRRRATADQRPSELKIALTGVDQLALLGSADANLRFLQEKFDGNITVRGETMILQGSAIDVEAMHQVVETLIEWIQAGRTIDPVNLSYLWDQITEGSPALTDESVTNGETLFFSSGTRQAVKVRSKGQMRYVDAIRNNDIVFAVGPAGTGKTYLAVVMAMDYLKRRLVDRIILVRPAIEAGEQLGFLPGDLQEKINPYLRPLYDALSDIIGTSKINKYMSNGVIEASPLAYMRGRTLNNAFVILDEAQNTTVGQMKMFLTRLGHQAKAVVTGDITQIDLNENQPSGLVHVMNILTGTDGIAFCHLDTRDVLRHPLVKRIVDAFEEAEQENGRG
jgi:phosphate starvation-inducible PhoH-like protein